MSLTKYQKRILRLESITHIKCCKCGEIKEKGCFYKSTGTMCKVCRREYIRDWQKTSQAYKRSHRRNARLYRERHPEVARAHRIANGLKKKLLKKRCEKCGRSGVRLHMHHPDYEKPDLVISLCVICHEDVHHRYV
jgi:hypothetical protein